MDTDFSAGVHLGYDWRCGYKVFGVVTDRNFTSLDCRIPSDPNGLGAGNDYIRNEMDWVSTIRARAGLTICDALVYVTAGPAIGWTGGVGTEFMFSHNDSAWIGGVGISYHFGGLCCN